MFVSMRWYVLLSVYNIFTDDQQTKAYDIEGSVKGFFDHRIMCTSEWKDILRFRKEKEEALTRIGCSRVLKAMALVRERAKEVEKRLAFRALWKQ